MTGGFLEWGTPKTIHFPDGIFHEIHRISGVPPGPHMDLVSGDEEVPTQTLSLEASRWRMWRLGFMIFFHWEKYGKITIDCC